MSPVSAACSSRRNQQAPAELAPAVAAAASLCAMFGRNDQSENRELRFRLTDLAGLLAQSWPEVAEPGMGRIFQPTCT